MIGVVQDFHFSSLRDEIGPIALTIRHQQFLQSGRARQSRGMEETLAFFEKTWKRLFLQISRLDYLMWDQQFEYMYSAEQRAQALTLLSSGMAILLACMGLFGLAAFTVEQRVKEIGVRKVLGASVSNIVMLISRTFAIMVLIANLFALAGCVFCDGQLDGWLCLSHGSFVVDICVEWRGCPGDALFTVSFHALRAAVSNSSGSVAA